MKNLKKLILGTIFASLLLFVAPAQQADASSITLSPPTKEFYYTLVDVDVDGSMDYWQRSLPNPYLKSQSGAFNNELISYMQFAITDPLSIFADPNQKSTGSLSLFLKDVAPDPALTGTGTLSIYRVNDEAVNNPLNQVIYTGQEAPIALGQLLSTINVDNSSFDDQVLTFVFDKLIQSTLVNGIPYLSFAIVANVDPGTDSILTLQYAKSTSLLVTPIPEPMSLTYILLGCCAMLFRRIKKIALNIFGL